MTSPVYGEAIVEIEADVDGFNRSLRRGLNNAANDVDSASNKLGKDAGSSFGGGFLGTIGGLGATLATSLGKAATAISALGVAGNTLSGVAATLGSLSGVLALIPAGAVAAGVAINTLKLGVQGFSEAVAATDAEEFNELAKTLAPSARAAAVSVRDLSGAFEEVQNSIQQELFADTAGVITRLGNTFLPILRTELSGVAADFNEAGTQTANFLLRGTQIETIRDILSNSREAVGGFSSSLSALTQILLDVVAVGSEFLPQLGEGFNGAAQRAADFVSAARESGDLKEFIQGGFDTLSELGDLFNNIGRIVSTVFDAFDAAGAGALNTLVGLTDQLADFLESAQGQDILQTLAETLGTIAGVVGTVFKAALEAVGPALLELLPLFADIAVLVGDVLAEAITLLVPVIVQLVQALLPLVPPILALISQLLPPLTELIIALVPIITTLVDILIAIIPPIADVATNILNVLIPAVEFIAEVLTRVGGIVRDVLTFVANIFVSVHTKVSAVVANAWRFIRETIFGAGSNVLNSVRNAFNSVVNAVGNALTSARNAVSNGLSAVVRFFTNLPGQIVNAISGLAGRLFNVGQNMLRGLIDGLASLGGQVLDFFINLVDRAIGGVLSFLGISSPSRLMRDIGRDTGLGLVQGLSDMVKPTEDTARLLAAAAAGAVGSINGRFGGTFSGAATLGGLTGGGSGTTGAEPTMSPSFVVDVRIGDTQINDIMDVRIREREREIRRRVPLRGRI